MICRMIHLFCLISF